MTQEYLEAVARIDFCYFALSEINKSINKRNMIDKMIDKATGYEKETTLECIELVKEIISSKKSINEDCSQDEKLLSELVKIYA